MRSTLALTRLFFEKDIPVRIFRRKLTNIEGLIVVWSTKFLIIRSLKGGFSYWIWQKDIIATKRLIF